MSNLQIPQNQSIREINDILMKVSLKPHIDIVVIDYFDMIYRVSLAPKGNLGIWDAKEVGKKESK